MCIVKAKGTIGFPDSHNVRPRVRTAGVVEISQQRLAEQAMNLAQSILPGDGQERGE